MKMRPVGEIYLELEKLYDELVDDHGMQMGDLIYWLHGHLKIHRPDSIEEYVADGSNPELRYGPKTNRKALKRKIFKELQTWENCKMELRTAEAVLKIIEKEQK
jgi:hypothetical protein